MKKTKNFSQYKDEDGNIVIYVSIDRKGNIKRKSHLNCIIHKKYYNKHNKRIENNKLKIIEYLGGECQHCGLKSPYPEVYDVHHLNPKDKISEQGFSNKPFKNIKDELDNCVLLCSNCHRIIHKTMRDKND